MTERTVGGQPGAAECGRAHLHCNSDGGSATLYSDAGVVITQAVQRRAQCRGPDDPNLGGSNTLVGDVMLEAGGTNYWAPIGL